MGDTWIVDMTDLQGLPPSVVTYFRSIVSEASVAPTGAWADTSIRCRCRPRGKRCPGYIRIRRLRVPSPVEWHCTSCDDKGLIRNWRKTECDMSRSQQESTSIPEEPNDSAISEDELLEFALFLTPQPLWQSSPEPDVNQTINSSPMPLARWYVAALKAITFEDNRKREVKRKLAEARLQFAIATDAEIEETAICLVEMLPQQSYAEWLKELHTARQYITEIKERWVNDLRKGSDP